MRGKPTPSKRIDGAERNIPAYAGKTSPRGQQPDYETEHPRVCGENAFFKVLVIGFRGTSPRMRGKHAQERMGESAFRNIPAYAGKTGGTVFTIVHGQEHPRVCGENRHPRPR